MRLKVTCGITAVVMSLIPVLLQAQEAGGAQDVMFEYGLEGTAGVKFFFGRLEGWYFGAKVPVVDPDADKVQWSSAMAETTLRDEFQGYSRGQYLGFNAGYGLSSGDRGIVFYGGVSALRCKQFRVYKSSLASMAYRDYYVQDRVRTRYKLGIVIGVYQRLRVPYLGLGFNTATSRFFFSIGWPVWNMFG